MTKVATLEEWLAVGRRAHPDVAIDAALFEATVREQSERTPVIPGAIVADLYLAAACARGDAKAIARVEAETLSAVRAQLARGERDPDVVDEVLQRVRTKLFLAADDRPRPRIAEYSGRGPLAAWVRVVAQRELATLRRERRPAGAAGDDAAAAEPDAAAELVAPASLSPELASLRARYLPALARAMRAAIEALEPRQRTLFRLHYVDGLSLERIGALYAVNKGTVSRWLAAAREAVLTRSLALVSAEIGASSADAKSLLGLLVSQLDVSLVGLLEPHA